VNSLKGHDCNRAEVVCIGRKEVREDWNVWNATNKTRCKLVIRGRGHLIPVGCNNKTYRWLGFHTSNDTKFRFKCYFRGRINELKIQQHSCKSSFKKKLSDFYLIGGFVSIIHLLGIKARTVTDGQWCRHWATVEGEVATLSHSPIVIRIVPTPS
jgi:hypothetical protein